VRKNNLTMPDTRRNELREQRRAVETNLRTINGIT
jgi:hypothetical protein